MVSLLLSSVTKSRNSEFFARGLSDPVVVVVVLRRLSAMYPSESSSPPSSSSLRTSQKRSGPSFANIAREMLSFSK